KRPHGPLARPSFLGEHHDGVALADALDGEVERLDRRPPVLAVDGDESGAAETPPEDGNLEEAHLGHEADRLRDRRQDTGDVVVAVMVADQDVALPRIDGLDAFRAQIDPRRADQEAGPETDDRVD